MSNFDIIQDVEGKEYLIFDNSELYDETNIGNKLEDFELLSQLGEGAFGEVYKVLSKLNNKVYAMKKLNMLKVLRKHGNRGYQLTLNETNFLEGLNNPHVIKYYRNFEIETIFRYNIIEYIPNGSIKNFIEAHKKFDKHIPEEQLWNIFLQCMEALTYIHSKGVIHRDIKPDNLLLDNNMVVKLGDFGCSALINQNNKFKNEEEMLYHGTYVGTKPYMSKEIYEEEYDQKVDVYAMGISFFEMCYFFNPKDEENKLKKEDVNVNYSTDLMDIINLMIEEDKNKRKTSEEIYEILKTEYTKKYLKSTSINSVMRCLCSFEHLTKDFLNISLKDNEKKPITKGFIDSIKCFSELIKWKDKINYFYRIFVAENPRLFGTKEIDPRFVFAFFMTQLHKELNEIFPQEPEIINTKKEMNLNLANFGYKGKEELEGDCLPHFIVARNQAARTSKIDMKFKYINDINGKFNSFIRNSFMGLMKQTNFCYQCKLKTYSFQSYFFITFDIEKIVNKAKEDNENISEIDLDDCFYFQNSNFEDKNNYCSECLKKTKHQVYKQFYLFPKLIIISFQRGITYNYKMPIIVEEKLDLNDSFDKDNRTYFKTEYNLVGYLGRSEKNGNEEFFSIVKKGNSWFYSGGLEFKQIDSPSKANSFGDIIMAFYQLIE